MFKFKNENTTVSDRVTSLCILHLSMLRIEIKACCAYKLTASPTINILIYENIEQ